MRRTSYWVFAILVAVISSMATVAQGQIAVVNMIPQRASGERNQDSEPNLAVNPANRRQIAGSAFTPSQGFCGANVAPIFVSTDEGNTWDLNCIVPSDAAGNGTGDITVRFAGAGSTLYGGILRLPGAFRLNILRTTNFTGPGAMTVLVDRTGAGIDQPYTQATTVGANDRVFIGDNDFNAGARTATIDQSVNAGIAAPVFNSTRLESRGTGTLGQDGPPIRPAIHPDGTIYAVFYGGRALGAGNLLTVDVVVVRDDTGGTGASPFTALLDTDGLSGVRVVTNRTVPFNNFSQAAFGQERFVSSNISIAVDPRNSSNVFVAWADGTNTANYTLHVRRSTNRGVTWSAADLRTINTATNPALAINSDGLLGFLYQQVTGTGAGMRWVTHLETTSNNFAAISDSVLATVPANTPVQQFIPYLGDYVHLMTVGLTFYGIFSANNTPAMANFPSGVRFQRNANFTSGTLLNTDNATPVPVSIDPFFFRFTPLQVIRSFCLIHPDACARVDLDRERIIIRCAEPVCHFRDPIPRNCLVKFDCPGCEGIALCPPFYQLFLDDVPDDWKLTIFDPKGVPIEQQLSRTDKGVVISFRPTKEHFIDGLIGDYFLELEGKGPIDRKIPARLKVGDRPYQKSQSP